MSGCWRGRQPRKRGSSWMSSVRYGPPTRASRRASRACGAAGPSPRSARRSCPRRGTGGSRRRRRDPERGVAAPASSRAESTSRCRTSSTESCDATARTASLTAFSAGLSGSGHRPDDSFRGNAALLVLDPGPDRRVRARRDGDRDHEAGLEGIGSAWRRSGALRCAGRLRLRSGPSRRRR